MKWDIWSENHKKSPLKLQFLCSIVRQDKIYQLINCSSCIFHTNLNTIQQINNTNNGKYLHYYVNFFRIWTITFFAVVHKSFLSEKNNLNWNDEWNNSIAANISSWIVHRLSLFVETSEKHKFIIQNSACLVLNFYLHRYLNVRVNIWVYKLLTTTTALSIL